MRSALISISFNDRRPLFEAGFAGCSVAANGFSSSRAKETGSVLSSFISVCAAISVSFIVSFSCPGAINSNDICVSSFAIIVHKDTDVKECGVTAAEHCGKLVAGYWLLVVVLV